jgi:hypothetical protein
VAILPTLSELEERLEEVRARRAAILAAPLEHSTGRSSYSNAESVKALDREERRILDQIRAYYRRTGRIGPARREVW